MSAIKVEKIELSFDVDSSTNCEPPSPPTLSNGNTDIGATTTTSATTTSTSAIEMIDEEDLQILSSKNAAKVKYPPGCPVWYDLTNFSPNRLDAKHGIVEAVYIDFETSARVYKVIIIDDDDDEGSGYSFLWQNQLAYAMKCPVLVKGMLFENNTTGAEPDKGMEGTILCPRTPRGDRKLSYSILFTQGNRVGVELGIETERVSFRKGGNNSILSTGKVLSGQQTRKTGEHDTKKVSLISDSQYTHSLDRRMNKRPEPSDKNTKLPHDGKADLKRTPGGETIKSHDVSKRNNSDPKEQLSAQEPCNNNNNNNNNNPDNALSSQRLPLRAPLHSTPNNKNHFFANDTNESRPEPAYSTTPTTEPNNEKYSNMHHSAVREQQPNRNNNPPSMLTIASPKEVVGDGTTTTTTAHFLKQHYPAAYPHTVTSSSGDNHRRDRWGPPALDDSTRQRKRNLHEGSLEQQSYCELAVPLWVTDSTTRSLFHHIIGESGEEKSFKLRSIVRETGCGVEILRGPPMRLAIQPITSNSSSHGGGGFGTDADVGKAREMVENSLLEFVESDGVRARLLYELALSVVVDNGVSSYPRRTDGVVQQRHYASNDLVWMKLLDLPTTLFQRSGLISLNEDLQRLVQVAKCSIEIFGHGLNNMKIPVQFCMPFVLIYVSGENYGHVLNDASKLVTDAMNERQLRCSRNNIHDSLALGKRRLPSDTNSSSSRSREHLGISSERPRKRQDAMEIAKCVLRVPLWVFQKCTHHLELFHHLVGQQNGTIGHKQKEIAANTNCSVQFLNCSSRDNAPMIINIQSKRGAQKPFDNVKMANNLIERSLLEYIDDKNSEGRLVYELAMNAKGSFRYRKARGAVQQISHIAPHRPVWMRLLEIPSSKLDGEFIPHAKHLLSSNMLQWIKGASACSVKWYCFGHSLPRLSGPYILVFGIDQDDVSEVADRVADQIRNHEQGSHCQFLKETRG